MTDEPVPVPSWTHDREDIKIDTHSCVNLCLNRINRIQKCVEIYTDFDMMFIYSEIWPKLDSPIEDKILDAVRFTKSSLVRI